MSLQLASITLEVLICLIALIAVLRGRKYMIGFVIAFGIYTYNDSAHLYNWKSVLLNDTILPILFFIATVSALFSIWEVYKN